MGNFFAPSPPKISDDPVAPTTDDDEVQAAKRRRAEIARKQSGVAATNLVGAASRETFG